MNGNKITKHEQISVFTVWSISFWDFTKKMLPDLNGPYIIESNKNKKGLSVNNFEFCMSSVVCSVSAAYTSLYRSEKISET